MSAINGPKRLIITTMRNEGPFILEWIAYHRLIGFTDFVVFSNDCDDGTDRMLARLDEMGLIKHLENPRKGDKTVQWRALNRAGRMQRVQRADWIMVSDVDEFLVIHAGAGHLDDLFAARPEADGFVLSWRMFGNADTDRYEPGMVMRQFTRAAPEALLWPWRAIQCKTLFRYRPEIEKLGVHRPDIASAHMINWVDDCGAPLGQIAKTALLRTEPRYVLAQMNHYALGSRENFLVKADRGKPNRTEDSFDLAYWIDRDLNQVEDFAILRHADLVEREINALLTDPVLAELHENAIVWRQRRIAELLQQPDPFRLFALLRQIGSTKLLTMDEQMTLLRQAQQIRRR
jgi:hypothetical protein